MEGPLLNLFGIFAFLKTCFSPKSEARRRASPPLSYGNPPPPEKKNLFHIQGFTFIKHRLEQLEIGQQLSLEIFQRYS